MSFLDNSLPPSRVEEYFRRAAEAQPQEVTSPVTGKIDQLVPHQPTLPRARVTAYERLEINLLEAVKQFGWRHDGEAEDIILRAAKSAKRCKDQSRAEVGEAYLAAATVHADRGRRCEDMLEYEKSIDMLKRVASCFEAGKWSDPSVSARIKAVVHLATHQKMSEIERDRFPEFRLLMNAIHRTPTTPLGAAHSITLAVNHAGECDYFRAIPVLDSALKISREHFGANDIRTVFLLYLKGFASRRFGLESGPGPQRDRALILSQTCIEKCAEFIEADQSDSNLKHEFETARARIYIDKPTQDLEAAFEVLALMRLRVLDGDYPAPGDARHLYQIESYISLLRDAADARLEHPSAFDERGDVKRECYLEHCHALQEILQITERFEQLGNNRQFMTQLWVSLVNSLCESEQDEHAWNVTERALKIAVEYASPEWLMILNRQMELDYRLGKARHAQSSANLVLGMYEQLYPPSHNQQIIISSILSLVERSPEDHLEWSMQRVKEGVLLFEEESCWHLRGRLAATAAYLCALSGQTENLESWLAEHDAHFEEVNDETLEEYLSELRDNDFSSRGNFESQEAGRTLEIEEPRSDEDDAHINVGFIAERAICEFYRKSPDMEILRNVSEFSRTVREGARISITDRVARSMLYLVEARYRLLMDELEVADECLGLADDNLDPCPQYSPFLHGAILATSGELLAARGEIEMSCDRFDRAYDNLVQPPNPTMESVRVLEKLVASSRLLKRDSSAITYQEKLDHTRDLIRKLPDLSNDLWW